MLRRSAPRALAALALVALAAGAPSATAATEAPGNTNAGPPYDYTKALTGQYTLIPLKNQAMISRTKHGYLFRAGQQDSHLTISITDNGGLRFVDTGTGSFRDLADACQKQDAGTGVAAVCRVPDGVSLSQPLLIEVWPRLGDDYVDGSTLPATMDMTVLADAGRDVAKFGAGDDFFNGHLGHDRILGGAGRDWIRSGDDGDTVWAGPGIDAVVGMDGADVLHGGAGNDYVDGGAGGDRLWDDTGADLLRCGDGRDTATISGGDDRVRYCEYVVRN